MAKTSPEILAHQEWLGQIQPVGLVVTAPVLVKQNVFADRQRGIEKQLALRDLLEESADGTLPFSTFARELLEWPPEVLAGSFEGPELPPTLTVSLPEYNDTLAPTFAIPEPEMPGSWLALVLVVPPSIDLDRAPAEQTGWRASPHARLERLLRETGIPIGLLYNGAALRLVYAPKGESSGHLTFTFTHLADTMGRPMVSALDALLRVSRITDVTTEGERLPALLRESRRYQNEVSTALAGQVLEALWELLRGFQRANDDSDGELLAGVLRDDPHEAYGGLLTTLMRLVFILYAEDRGLMPAGDTYQRCYSVSGLFERLRDDQARYPDTMDARYGAWAQLLTLFRLIHDGGSHGDVRFTARKGRLFDPDAYPFLEGRPPGVARQVGRTIDVPRISDGTIFRLLQNLLILDGERLSYRALDVEQVGSVYEAMMGFALGVAPAPSIAVSPKHIVINLDELLEQKGKDRASWLKDRAELKITQDALARASTTAEAVAALGTKVSRYTPTVIAAGGLYLQPTEERRRSGSHYTPRSLTEPIVRTTLRPILERLGSRATPEAILDLKICDPAMGSGAFLVEACRALSERLVRAWEVHGSTPKVPDDEDVLTYARRLIAERCLYGVDKNIFAVDLAKLSLWLATLAREHPFTFLDHSLRHGDSLVGLSREQIASLHWSPDNQISLIRGFVDRQIAVAQTLREEIQRMGSSDDVPEKARLFREANEALEDVRLIGDVVVSSFLEGDKPRAREALRVARAGQIELWLGSGGGVLPPELTAHRVALREGEHAIPAFHWELEFPEVFTRASGGFDAFVGNPPFMGGTRISEKIGAGFLLFLCEKHKGIGGRADLVVHFFRQCFDLLHQQGTIGFVATNTASQGESRQAGLAWIVRNSGTIYAATRRLAWPGDAAVIVSVVHIAKSVTSVCFELDGKQVSSISSRLLPNGLETEPLRLGSNAGISFRGHCLLGMGFTFDDSNEEASPIALMEDILRREPQAKERVVPYIGGEELNASPNHLPHRWAIYFDELSEVQARQGWPQLFAVLEKKVRPFRITKDRLKYPRMVNEWWKYWNNRVEMMRAIGEVEEVLAISQVGSHCAFTFVPARMIHSDQLIVFSTSRRGFFGVMQSRVHEIWARDRASSMKDDLRYTPTDCFETFALPTNWQSDPVVEKTGRELFDYRAMLMVRNHEGLTRTYNRFHDPDERDADILRLRDLHDAIDRAVLDAYGWTDIRPTCQFLLDYEDEEDENPGKGSKRKKPWRYRWPDEVRDEVLGRLLALNADRAAEERLSPATARSTGESHERARRSGRRGDRRLFD